MSITKEKGRAPARARPHITATSHSAPLDARPARTIVLQNEPFGEAFDVLLVPPPATGAFGREFRSYRRASGFAEGLSVALGLPMRDTTGRGE